MTPLQKLEAICTEMYERWDKDQRAGKLLQALCGTLPNYRKDVDEVRAALMPGLYLIWSNEHKAWWRPDSRGYTIDVAQAGRYERDDAIRIASGSRDGWFVGEVPAEIAISEADVLAHKMQPAPKRNSAA